MNLGHEINDLIRSCDDPTSAVNRALGALVAHVNHHSDPVVALGDVEAVLADLRGSEAAALSQLEKDEERQRQTHGSQEDRP